MNPYVIMHEHDTLRDGCPSLVKARAAGRKTLRYVAIIEGVNHSSSWSKPRDIKGSHCSGNGRDKLKQLERKRYLPAEKYPYLLLRFYDTYFYYSIPRIY